MFQSCVVANATFLTPGWYLKLQDGLNKAETFYSTLVAFLEQVISDFVGQPPTIWIDDIKLAAGSRWIQAAQNRGIWNSLPKKPKSSSGRLSVDMMMMMMKILA
ncbi:jg2358 [Pararge aegeria aegeria]|uniref:Jg2358 protein n=1 Tax=Pararge aegeria aegeria TaxID=348720 RepID=A0A8S4S980_9NEOP|nr:jg2358 [Pararge aegeria aegeria]